jgi:DMSO/TMAO reductase YedYZ molybdopterin-dependent catalytic subunit
MNSRDKFLAQHADLTRRFFMQLGVAGTAALGSWQTTSAEPSPPLLEEAIAGIESYFTKQDDFGDVSRGKPIPHTLPEEERVKVGLTRETWQMEVRGDPENKPDLRTPLTKEKGTAFDFKALMDLARDKAVRFPKVMTCNNIGCPLGMGIWEGVPLRDVIWKVQPRQNVRRVFYYGYHNDKPEQMFRSSMPIGRVLEDPLGLPPVILCYKLNGQFLTPQRGGPVRIVVPEAYGFKSVKWITDIVLTNLASANDTYIGGNNDIDSWLKTFAATLSIPTEVKPGQPIPVTGYAQVGISGLSKVQVWVSRRDAELPVGDRYFSKAPWKDAIVLPPPKEWGGDLPDNKIPSPTQGFDPETGKPKSWPMLLSKAHWAALLPGLEEGEYTFRCRTVDQNGIGQPLPRPFRKSGGNVIEQVRIVVSS